MRIRVAEAMATHQLPPFLTAKDSSRYGRLNGVLAAEPLVPGAAVPITGPFGTLPPELIEAVAAQLLHVSSSLFGVHLQLLAKHSSWWLSALLCTCKGMGVVTFDTRAEAVARSLSCTTPAFWRREPHPYLSHAFREIEAFLTVRALLTSLRRLILHCAEEHCAGTRRINNADLKVCADLWHQGPPVLQHALDGRVMRLDVAWNAGATLLCTTDAGAIVVTADGVVKAVEGTPARVLSPQTELHVAWSIETHHPPTMAASRGALVALAAGGVHPAGPYELTIYDMMRKARLYHREDEPGHLQGMWLLPCMSLVRLVNTNPASENGEYHLKVDSCTYGSPARNFHKLVACNHEVVAFAFGADTGALAMLIAEKLHPDFAVANVEPPWKQHLVTFRVACTGIDRFRTIPFAYKTTQPHYDSVAISPSGDVLVVCGRGHVVPSFLIYNTKFDGSWGMLARCRIEEVYRCVIPEIVSGRTSMHFSPCGSLLLVFVHAIHTGLLILNMRDIKDEGERTQVQTQFFRVAPSGLPAVARWGNGLWMETHDQNSVMRLGLRAT